MNTTAQAERQVDNGDRPRFDVFRIDDQNGGKLHVTPVGNSDEVPVTLGCCCVDKTSTEYGPPVKWLHKLTFWGPRGECNLVQCRVFASRPILIFTRSSVGHSNGVVRAANWAVFGRRVVDAEENIAILLRHESIIHLGHLAVQVDQFGGFHMKIGCVRIKLPTNVVRDGFSVVLGFATRMGERVRPSRLKEPELVFVSLHIS